MHGHSQGLNERPLAERHAWGQLVAEVIRRDKESYQRVMVRRGCGEDHIVTEVVLAGEASLAVTTGEARLNSDAVAWGEVGDAATDLGDGADGPVVYD